MKSIKLVWTIGCLSLAVAVQAQVETPVTVQTGGEEAYVFKDPRIDVLIQQQRYLNTLALRNVSGYRVQVLSTTNRGAANQARAKLMQLFPEYSTYMDYQSPYFRIRIGDFLQRDSAATLQEELGQYFPNGVFTVKDRIKIDPDVLLEQVKSQHGTDD